MIDSHSDSLSIVLDALKRGDSAAEERLFRLVYAELHRMAHQQMRRERPGQTLETTALVNEAYLRLSGDRSSRWENRRHFFGAAARAMRQILVDAARSRATAKRGGDAIKVTLQEDTPGKETSVDVLALDEALERLGKDLPRHAEIVRHRFFLGLNVEDTARLLDVSERTVYSDWQFAKMWLKKEMRPAEDQRDHTDGGR